MARLTTPAMTAPSTAHPMVATQPGHFYPRLLTLAVAACFTIPTVYALPNGAQVVAGAATISRSGNALNIANTPGAIINWANFSVGALESVRFQQQSALSSVLNRVTGSEASAIYGALSSNGRVWLINPNGILFGQGARVDIPGFVASTLNISDADFLAGKLNFTAGALAGSIRNEGSLTNAGAGNIYLIAPDINNTGLINAPNGEVLLAAGRQISLVDNAHPDVQIVVSAPTDQAVNLGEIVAQNGKVSLFGALLKQKGLVSADSVAVDAAGRIVFRGSQTTLEAGSQTTARSEQGNGGQITIQSSGDTQIQGQVDASSSQAQGGNILALGHRVAVGGNAVLDASGEQGGRILVGGDFQGKNPAVQNAQTTLLGKNATLKANAGAGENGTGKGGTIIVWGDGTTRAYGNIEARGGKQGGDGGFVEVSGKEWLDFQAKVDTSAGKGELGRLLLDPASIVIGNTADIDGGISTETLDITGDIANADHSGASSLITAGALSNLLKTTGVTLAATDFITVASAINKLPEATPTPTTTTLTLNAGNSININANISSSTDAGPLNLVFDSQTINITSGANLTTSGGNISLTANKLNITNAGTLSTTGNIQVLTKTVGINLGSSTDASPTDLEVSNTELNKFQAPLIVLNSPSSDITVSAPISLTGPRELTLAAPSSTSTVAINDSISVSGGALVLNVLSSSTNITAPASINTNGGQAHVEASMGNISVAGSVTNAGGITLYAPTGNVNITGSLQNGNYPILLTGNTTVDGSIDTNYSLKITGNLINNGSITIGGGAEMLMPPVTLDVTSNFTQAPGASLAMSANKQVAIGGTADLQGSLTISGTPTAGYTLVLNRNALYPPPTDTPIEVPVASNFTSKTVPSGFSYNNATARVSATCSTCIFLNSTGDWSDLQNWSNGTNAGYIPAANAAVTINSGSMVSVMSNVGTINSLGGFGGLTISSGGMLTILGNASIGTLILSGGSLTGANTQGATANNLTVSNAFSQTLGIISGFNSISINQQTGNLAVGFLSTVIPAGGYASGTQAGAISLFAPDTVSGGASISQQPGTSLGGGAVYASAANGVALTNANPAGRIAGQAGSGGFSYTSNNPIHIDAVYGGPAGITTTGDIKLTSTAAGNAFSQSAPLVGAGLALVGTGGGANLTHAGNSFGNFAADLSGGGITIDVAQGTIGNLRLGSVGGVIGVNAPSAAKIALSNTLTNGLLTVGENLSATNGIVALKAKAGINIGEPATSAPTVTGKDVWLASDGNINLYGTLVGSSSVQLSNLTNAAPFTVRLNADTPAGGNVIDTHLAPITTPELVLGHSGTTSNTSALTINAGSTVSRASGNLGLVGTSVQINAPITLSTGWLLFDAGQITAGSPITAQSVAGKASGPVLLNFTGDINVGNYTIPAMPINGIAGDGTVQLSASGSITGSAPISALNYLNLNAGMSIGSSTTPPGPLNVVTPAVFATATNGSVWLTGHSSQNPLPLAVGGSAGGTFNVTNYGHLSVPERFSGDVRLPAITTNLGGVTLIANSPLTVNGVISSGGTVQLTASGSTASDTLTLAPGSSITVPVGQSVTLTGGTVSNSATITDTNSATVSPAVTTTYTAPTSPPPPPPPTPTETVSEPPTVAPTVAPTEPPTLPPTVAPTEPPTLAPTAPPQSEPVVQQTQQLVANTTQLPTTSKPDGLFSTTGSTPFSGGGTSGTGLSGGGGGEGGGSGFSPSGGGAGSGSSSGSGPSGGAGTGSSGSGDSSSGSGTPSGQQDDDDQSKKSSDNNAGSSQGSTSNAKPAPKNYCN